MSDIKSLADEAKRLVRQVRYVCTGHAYNIHERAAAVDAAIAAIDALAQAAQPAAQPERFSAVSLTREDWRELGTLLCSISDNLGDMPITDEYAAKACARADALLSKLDRFAADPHPAPAAPTDERALFEAAAIANDPDAYLRRSLVNDDAYAGEVMGTAWRLWQARARIARGEQA
jgi:hypothetical protein